MKNAEDLGFVTGHGFSRALEFLHFLSRSGKCFLHKSRLTGRYFESEKPLWTLRFGFLSGHDFSRAAKAERDLGFSPCRSASCMKCLSEHKSKELISFEDSVNARGDGRG